MLGMSITFLRCSSKWVCVRGSGNSLRVRTGRFVAGRGGGGKDALDWALRRLSRRQLAATLVDVSACQEYLNF